MGITSVTFSSGIQPTKPRNAYLAQATPTASTYYTVLSATQSKGIVSRILLSHYGGTTYYDSSYLNIRITVDGGTAQVFTGNATLGAWLKGFPQGTYNASGSNYQANPAYNLGFQSPVYFTQSVLIEVMSTGGAFGTMYANCDYSLV